METSDIIILVLSGLLGVSEVLPMTGLVKANSNLILVKDILGGLLKGFRG